MRRVWRLRHTSRPGLPRGLLGFPQVPKCFCREGYGAGNMPPHRCSDRARCKAGNSSTEPNLCARNVLLAHSVVRGLV